MCKSVPVHCVGARIPRCFVRNKKVPVGMNSMIRHCPPDWSHIYRNVAWAIFFILEYMILDLN